MKKTTILYLFVMFCAYCTQMNAQDERNIIFCYGLGGAKSAWVKYDEYFNNTRKANPFRFEYTEDNGMQGAVNDAYSKITSAFPSSTYSNNIAIAHSQGGLVLRGMAKSYPGTQCPFGGFITVGSPHKGAKVVNSYKSGQFTAFTQDAVSQMFAGPTANAIALLPPWVPSIVNSTLPYLVENFIVQSSEITNSTTNDYYEGAPYLTNLGTHVANMPKVGIVSAEDTPNTHWKTITSYTLKNVTDLELDEVDDNDVEQGMQKAHNFYSKMAEYHRFRATIAFSPWKRIWHGFQANQWEKGFKWIANSEDKYNSLIGNIELTAVPAPQQICPWACTTYECINNLAGCSFQSPMGLTYIATTYPIDGIVNTNAQFLPGAIHNFIIQGANHAQERNHPEVTKVFNKLLDGETGISTSTGISFYKVPKL